MRAIDYRAMDMGSLWHPYTRHSAIRREPFPVIVRGKGPYLYDTGGVRYLDAISSWWACNLGHGHPRLVRAIAGQAGKLQHSILGNMSHPAAIGLASELAALFPESPRRVFFAGDGASAVEAALKIAIQYWHNIGRPGRNRIASLRGAYHGDTLGAVSVGYVEGFHKPFRPLLFPVHRAEAPFCAACAHGRDEATCRLECLESMKAIVRRNSRRLAAVIVEPLCQGAAGMRIYSPRYLKALWELCREHGILLIADEIAVGMGRTGRMFAFQHAGVDPDIVCIGKGLSGGCLPLSATIVGKKLFDTFSDLPEDHTFYHGHTFAGNPIACAAGLETLAIYREDGIVEQAARSGEVLRGEMQALAACRGVRHIRCLGMIGACEVRDAGKVRRLLIKDRILARPLGNVVYLMLPLNVTPALIRRAVASLRDAIRRA